MILTKIAKHIKAKRLAKKNDKNHGSDVALRWVIVLFLIHSVEMFYFYDKYQSIPETYAVTVVTALIGECGLLGWIYKIKNSSKIGSKIEDQLTESIADSVVNNGDAITSILNSVSKEDGTDGN